MPSLNEIDEVTAPLQHGLTPEERALKLKAAFGKAEKQLGDSR